MPRPPQRYEKTLKYAKEMKKKLKLIPHSREAYYEGRKIKVVAPHGDRMTFQRRYTYLAREDILTLPDKYILCNDTIFMWNVHGFWKKSVGMEVILVQMLGVWRQQKKQV